MPQAVARLGGAPIFLGVLAVAAAVGIGYMIYKEYKSNRSSPSEAHRMRQLGAPHSIRNERTTREKSEKDQISGEFEAKKSSNISISKPAVFPVGPKAIPSDNTSYEASREELKDKRPQETRAQVASRASPRKASAANVDAVQDALPTPPPYSESVQTQAPSSLGLPSLIARKIQTPAGGEHELEHASDFVIVRHESTSESGSTSNDGEQSLFDESESVTEILDVEYRKINREDSTSTMSAVEAARPMLPVLLSDDVHSELKSKVNYVDMQKAMTPSPRIQLPTPPPETLELSSPSAPLPPPISLLQAPPLLERSISNSTMQSFRTAQSSASESSGDTDFYSLPPSMPETPTAGATYSPVGDGEHLTDDDMLAKLDSALGLVGSRRGDGLT